MAVNPRVLAGKVGFNKIRGWSQAGAADFRGESQHLPVINRDSFKLWGDARVLMKTQRLEVATGWQPYQFPAGTEMQRPGGAWVASANAT